MSRKRKLYDRIKNNPKNVSFQDMDQLLKEAGFTLKEQGSGTSHFVYKIKGCFELLTIPYSRPLGEVYVKKALKLIQAYGNLDDD